MTAVASLVWIDAFRVLRALLGAVALSVEAMQSPDLPFEPWVHSRKATPARLRWPPACAHAGRFRLHAAFRRPELLLAALRAAGARPGVGGARGWARGRRARNQLGQRQPAHRPETGRLYKAGNFYGATSPLLDTWKIDFASMANWGNALVAVLVDDRFKPGACRLT